MAGLISVKQLAKAAMLRDLEERAIKLGQGTGGRFGLLRTGIRSEWTA